MTRALLLALMAATTAAAADQSSLRLLNALRQTECPGRSAAAKPLTENSKLDRAARYLREGQKPKDALLRADYQADQMAMIHITGPMDDASVKQMLTKSYCSRLIEPGLTEAGILRDGQEMAVILAAPFAPPATSDANKVSLEVLQLVNAARAKPRRCGSKAFPPAPPLTLDSTLSIAARAHAKDMAAHSELSHTGSDGSTPDERITRAGYAWKNAGENIASGQLSSREVVDGWLSSPHHCENIMERNFTQMAVAYAVAPKKQTGIYWAQVFARPKLSK